MTHLTDWQRGYQAGGREAHLLRDVIAAAEMIRFDRLLIIGYSTGALALLATGQGWWLVAALVIFTIIAAFHCWAAVKRHDRARAELRYLSRYRTTYLKETR